jgi:hypothetical protein
MTQTTEELMIHVVTGSGSNARKRDARLRDVLRGNRLEDLDTRQILALCEEWFELPAGDLRNREVDVTEGGHVIVAAPKVYG